MNVNLVLIEFFPIISADVWCDEKKGIASDAIPIPDAGLYFFIVASPVPVLIEICGVVVPRMAVF